MALTALLGSNYARIRLAAKQDPPGFLQADLTDCLTYLFNSGCARVGICLGTTAANEDLLGFRIDWQEQRSSDTDKQLLRAQRLQSEESGDGRDIEQKQLHDGGGDHSQKQPWIGAEAQFEDRRLAAAAGERMTHLRKAEHCENHARPGTL